MEFVGWYNRDPNFASSNIDLNPIRRVAVIGHGNVALDVARILLKPWRSLIGTSINPTALEALKLSSVDTVDIIGRRGPLQVLIHLHCLLAKTLDRCLLQLLSSERCFSFLKSDSPLMQS